MASPPDPHAGDAASPAAGRRWRRCLWTGLLLLVAGLVWGMAAARYGLPPYAQLNRLHDRYFVTKVAHGPTPGIMRQTDPRALIALRRPEDVPRRRAEVVRFLWGRVRPAGRTAQLYRARNHRAAL